MTWALRSLCRPSAKSALTHQPQAGGGMACGHRAPSGGGSAGGTLPLPVYTSRRQQRLVHRTLRILELQPPTALYRTERAFHWGLPPLARGTVLHGSVPSSAHRLIFQRTGGVRDVLCRLPLLGFFTVLPLAALPGSWRRGWVLAAGGSGHHGRVRRHPHGRSIRHGSLRDAGGFRGGIGRFLRRLLDGPGLFPPFLARGNGIAAAPLGRTVARRLFLGTGRAEGYIRRPLADALFLAGSHVLLARIWRSPPAWFSI